MSTVDMPTRELPAESMGTIGSLMERYIADVLAGLTMREAKIDAAAADLEKAGCRIVDGGQVGTVDDDDRYTWKYDDWRTGTVLFSGLMTAKDSERAIGRLDPENRWYHIDNVGFQFSAALPLPLDGFPESLADALGEWTENNRDEARRLIGAPRVEQCSSVPGSD